MQLNVNVASSLVLDQQYAPALIIMSCSYLLRIGAAHAHCVTCRTCRTRSLEPACRSVTSLLVDQIAGGACGINDLAGLRPEGFI